jgi:hypothetical protein
MPAVASMLGAGVLAVPRRPARQTIVYVLAGQHASAGRRGSRVGLARELPLQPMTDARAVPLLCGGSAPSLLAAAIRRRVRRISGAEWVGGPQGV